MGLFSRSKKKNSPPSAFQPPAGWKRLAVAPGVGMNFPESWTVTEDDRLRLEDADQDLRVSVSIYSIPADNNPQVDDLFRGLHNSWKAHYTDAGPVVAENDCRWVRMNTDEDVLHLMSLSMRSVGQTVYAAFLMFTFSDERTFEENQDTFRRILASLAPLS